MNFLLDLLFPKKCAGCKKTGTYFCSDCISAILQKDLICPVCEEVSMGGETHPLCGKTYSLDGLWTLGWYQGALRNAVKDLKYRRVSNISESLADLILDYWRKFKPIIFDEIRKSRKQWVIVPVPLHWWRQNYRGFNQAAAIGQILSRSLEIDYCDALKRIRYTKPQVKLKGKERRQNIRDAFALSAMNDKRLTMNVLLIDDVWTTGSTLKECCYILKKNGAQKVWAITLAR